MLLLLIGFAFIFFYGVFDGGAIPGNAVEHSDDDITANGDNYPVRQTKPQGDVGCAKFVPRYGQQIQQHYADHQCFF